MKVFIGSFVFILSLLLLAPNHFVAAATSTPPAGYVAPPSSGPVGAHPIGLPSESDLPPVKTSPNGSKNIPPVATSTGAVVPDANSCFAYYKFGSVQTVVTSQTPVTTAGVPLVISAVTTNSNDYPIIDGAVYIKVFKKRPDGAAVNGPELVDQFFATDSMDLAAHASAGFTFTYDIPAYAETGDYEIATFFTTSKKFNLSGLSFTDDVLGSVWDFSIRGGQDTGIGFDKDKVTLAGAPYYFASYPPTEPQNEPVVVSAPLVNTTAAGELVKVQWTVYSWDAQLASNIVATSSVQEVLVPPHATTSVSYPVPQNTDPVYLIVGQETYLDTKSIIDVRFAREGVNVARLNFPAVTGYPLQAGVPVTLFSCLYNSGLATVIPPNTINLSLTGPSGNIIEQFSEKLPVTGVMMLAKKVFTPKSTYDDFTLKATLTDTSGKVVDQVSLHYDCQAIDPALCTKAKPISKTILWVLGIVLVIVIAALLYWLNLKKFFRKKK